MHEGFFQLLLDFCGVDNPLINLGLVKSVLDALLDFLSKKCFDILRDMLAVDAMAVGHCEEVGAPILTQVRKHQEAVLVDLVGVLGRVARLGGEGKLGYTVVKLLISLPRLDGVRVPSGRDLFGNGSSDVAPAVRAFGCLLYTSPSPRDRG